MDQDASSEGEDLNADLHNFDETCRLLQARSEKRLQKVKSARAAENEDIELKKLALQELKAKHNEELQPLEAALQSGHARKRKHEEEIQQLEHRISDFKSWKPNSEELPVRLLLFFIITINLKVWHCFRQKLLRMQRLPVRRSLHGCLYSSSRVDRLHASPLIVAAISRRSSPSLRSTHQRRDKLIACVGRSTARNAPNLGSYHSDAQF